MKKKKKAAKISDLKQGVEKKEKSKLAKQEKEMKPVARSILTGFRTVFWIFIVCIIALGVLQIVKSKQPKIIENIHRYEFDESESDQAKTFAESFVRDYLTYGSEIIKETDYRKKIQQYLVDAVSVGRPEFGNGYSEVFDTMVWSVEKIDENRSNIIVKADVVLTNNNELEKTYDSLTGEQISVPVKSEKVYYVSVPILAQDGRVVINDYPAFLSVADKLDANIEYYDGTSTASDSEKKEITALMEDFYDVYYSGTEGQIKSFFKEDPMLVGLENEFEFSVIKQMQVYKEDEKYKAIILVEIMQSDIGAIFNQRHLVTLEKTKDRWIIIDMKNRGN